MVRGQVMFPNSNSILILWIICRFHSKSAVWKKRVTHGPTDRPTDRPTNRDAWTHLKILLVHSFEYVLGIIKSQICIIGQFIHSNLKRQHSSTLTKLPSKKKMSVFALWLMRMPVGACIDAEKYYSISSLLLIINRGKRRQSNAQVLILFSSWYK